MLILKQTIPSIILQHHINEFIDKNKNSKYVLSLRLVKYSYSLDLWSDWGFIDKVKTTRFKQSSLIQSFIFKMRHSIDKYIDNILRKMHL